MLKIYLKPCKITQNLHAFRVHPQRVFVALDRLIEVLRRPVEQPDHITVRWGQTLGTREC